MPYMNMKLSIGVPRGKHQKTFILYVKFNLEPIVLEIWMMSLTLDILT